MEHDRAARFSKVGQRLSPFLPRSIHGFLDSFYTSRIGIRMIIGQYVALRQPRDDARVVGLLNTSAAAGARQ